MVDLSRQAAHDAGIQSVLIKPVRNTYLLRRIMDTLITHPPPGRSAQPTTERMPRMQRVLLAEDNKLNQIVAAGTLQKLGYDVDIVDGGVDAVEACAAHASTPS